MSAKSYMIIGFALTAAALISYFCTPLAVKFAKFIGAVDVPKDSRRMHNHPIPLLGGLAIIAGFLLSTFAVTFIFSGYCGIPYQNIGIFKKLMQLLPGALIIIVLGVVDDRYALPAWPKFFVQCVAAGITVALGVRINFISGSVRLLHSQFVLLGYLSVPVTILWIVGMTNAINFIDGLDGLAAGISSIASITMLTVAIIQGVQQLPVAILTAALAGGCIGLLPFNKNPARVFMGDTGSTFLGFTLAVISIQGLFKFYAAISFAAPVLILGLPILDTASAIIRRLAQGKAPWSPDRNHIHHKLIDMGLSQKQAVGLLYSISVVLGIMAVIFTCFSTVIGWKFLVLGIVIIILITYITLKAIRRYNAKAGTAEPDKPGQDKNP